MKSITFFGCLLSVAGSLPVCGLLVFCLLSFDYSRQNPLVPQEKWPNRYSATFGFELMVDHNGLIIVASADSTCQAWLLGVRPGMEVLGWNTLPIRRKLESMNIRRYRKSFPVMTDQNIRMMLLTRGRPGETAEIFFMTISGNNRGIRLTARK
jgi:hypothetical protein